MSRLAWDAPGGGHPGVVRTGTGPNGNGRGRTVLQGFEAGTCCSRSSRAFKASFTGSPGLYLVLSAVTVSCNCSVLRQGGIAKTPASSTHLELCAVRGQRQRQAGQRRCPRRGGRKVGAAQAALRAATTKLDDFTQWLIRAGAGMLLGMLLLVPVAVNLYKLRQAASCSCESTR